MGLANTIRIGIDAGGTLVKIAYILNDKLELLKLPSKELLQAVNWVKETLDTPEICVTGGKAEQLAKLLPFEMKRIVEFEATCKGVQYLMSHSKQEEGPFVLVNVGTGTSIHYVNGEEHVRIGGTGVGGGTMIGLSRLLTGIENYQEFILSEVGGQRDELDLKVKHIYEGSEPPIPGELTASNFGNLNSVPANVPISDYLSSVIGLVGETVATASVLAAAQRGISRIVYIGSSFSGNQSLKKVVAEYTVLREGQPIILDNGEYSGAIGALLSL
ncbi:type II pantothenate kinase [Paenibacillus albiflavus]|uniref:type II pantothenate kinase n=1 Tax=Paenibacillus albiflavus TaxID=2545760 RepID=UPI0038B232F9